VLGLATALWSTTVANPHVGLLFFLLAETSCEPHHDFLDRILVIPTVVTTGRIFPVATSPHVCCEPGQAEGMIIRPNGPHLR
jgi:hypothetical protein